MRVAQLIADTEWFAGHKRPSSPAVSVLMPTFRRGADGLFLRAARSVLNQTDVDLELIVIDDASTDGTAGQIRDLMLTDGRVSCLHHPKNVGLPAVSEYEAYVRANGRIIAFAFDDFLFEPDAIGAMSRFMDVEKSAAAYGRSALVDAEGGEHPLNQPTLDTDRLRFMNCICNSAVMLSRETVEDVGLYDPHVALTRLCDWDLWRRVAALYKIDRLDLFIGRELGLGRKDSLGNTYPLHFETMQEYMSQPRNEKLRPAAFNGFDLWSVPAHASWPLREHVIASQHFFRAKTWAPPQETDAAEAPQPRHVVTVVSEPSASVDLYWSVAYASDATASVNFTPPMGFSELVNEQVMRSDLVVIARDLYASGNQEIINFATETGIPVAYFVDDNFSVLAKEDEAWTSYGSDRIRKALRPFHAIIVTSRPLQNYFSLENLHKNVHIVDCAFDPALLRRQRRLKRCRAQDGALRVGCVGGDFRMENLINNICPALDALDLPVELFVRETMHTPDIYLNNGTVIAMPPRIEFRRFLDEWTELDLDLLVHPSGATLNIDYKSDNAVLVALYLGAAPILCDERAYGDLDEAKGVLKVDGSETEWAAAIGRASSKDYREGALAKLESYCVARFDGSRMTAALVEILETIPPISAISAARRGRKALKFLERRHFHG